MPDGLSTPVRVMHRDHAVDLGRNVLISVYGSPGKLRGHIAGRPEVDLPYTSFDEACRALDEIFLSLWPAHRCNARCRGWQQFPPGSRPSA